MSSAAVRGLHVIGSSVANKVDAEPSLEAVRENKEPDIRDVLKLISLKTLRHYCHKLYESSCRRQLYTGDW
jgi:hypothetical protein